jgi:integrase
MSAEPLRVLDGGRAPRGWEALWRKDVWCLAVLDERDRTIVLVLAFTGFRVSSVVTLMRDCVEVGSDGHPYLRYFNVKGSREVMLPIPPLLAERLKRQEAFLAERFPDTEWLFPSRLHRGAKRGAFHINLSTVSLVIERHVRRGEIRTAEGKLALDVHPHLFRHHVGTSMVNDNIPLTVIQEVLDHGSVEMTARYARMRDETVKQAVWRWHERVNVRGERIALPVGGPLQEAAWMKERVEQSLARILDGLDQIEADHADAGGVELDLRDLLHGEGEGG